LSAAIALPIAKKYSGFAVLKTLAIENYRSLRSVVVPLGKLNTVKGLNAPGKSNLYKALRLLADTAAGHEQFRRGRPDRVPQPVVVLMDEEHDKLEPLSISYPHTAALRHCCDDFNAVSGRLRENII